MAKTLDSQVWGQEFSSRNPESHSWISPSLSRTEPRARGFLGSQPFVLNAASSSEN